MWLILSTICIGLVLWFILKEHNKDYWKKRNVVQLNDLYLKFMFGDRSFGEIFKEVYDNHPNELHVGSFLMMKPALVLRNIQNIQAVLTTDFENFHSRGSDLNDNDLLGDNILFISDYQRWKTIRQKMTPIFTSSKLKSMTSVIEKCAWDFTEMVKQNKELRDKPFSAIYTYTTASIGASVCGIDTPFLQMSWKAVEPSVKANLKFATAILSKKLFKLLELRIFGEHEDFFIGAMKRVIAARKKSPQQINDFIGLCVELQKAGPMKDKSNDYELEPTDELLAAQAFFFFLAGADTGANTMHFTLLELSSNPDVLQRLHEEIDRVFEETNGRITYEVVDKLVYLNMIINEAMRKYPLISSFQRECARDTVLPVGNLKVEKGVLMVIPVFAIHRDEKLFPNPEKFDPERFAPENAANFPKFGYMPFGEGKRTCIGSRYARIQVVTGLAFLLRSFTLKPQKYEPKRFEKSPFSTRDTEAKYELVLRENVM
ncbi:cytochrome P450 6B5-like [Ostrinia nubilalis]|uniref:cytochrome P450 6B5-like n=1 Tax=Ostrinia nubilalis TaxID=29057 RepID=UPI0030826708